jgi:hypothetical protein
MVVRYQVEGASYDEIVTTARRVGESFFGGRPFEFACDVKPHVIGGVEWIPQSWRAEVTARDVMDRR